MATQLVTVKQAAALLGVSGSNIYNMLHAERIPYFRVGVGRGTIRIDRDDLERLKWRPQGDQGEAVMALKHLGDG